MRRRLTTALAVTALGVGSAFGLAACGGDDEDTTTVEEVTGETTVDSTELTVEEPTASTETLENEGTTTEDSGGVSPADDSSGSGSGGLGE